MIRIALADEEATRRLGRRLGEGLSVGSVVALYGPLGAGKTTLCQGLAAALGVVGPVPSPTFVLMREYLGRLRLVHVDAYRLGDLDDALAIGLDEHLPGDGVTVIEWAERVAEMLPGEAVHVRLDYQNGGRTAEVDGAEWLDGE